ncbi:MAG: hypothetical protein IJW32_05410 [Clostridia bacterium]|nr:hypothetical protein [Clostridia bacterium]
MSPKNIDYSFKILEEILMLKEYKNKEEVISVAEAMYKVAEKNDKCSQAVKDSYKEALNKLNTLSYDEMKEIITILSSYDEN